MITFSRAVVFTLLLAACAPRGQAVILPEAATVGSVQEIFIGTSRGKNAQGAFDSSRSEVLSFGRFDVSVPPDRDTGEIKYPPARGTPDPTRHFLTTQAGRYPSAAAFRAALRQDMAQKGREAVIFVHGYNNNYAEGIYRIAQMKHDLQLPGTVVHYSWPSAASPLGYVYDRDSALFARDGLEQLIEQVKDAGAQRIVLVAHSMGSSLMMETLRQISLNHNTAAMNRIGGVILISPDLDIDVFRAQALSIKKLPQPFIVFSSERDAILRISAGLTGQAERLGSLTNLEKIKDLPITVMDTAAFNKGAGHFNLGDSPSLLRLFDGILSIDQNLTDDHMARIGLLPGAVLSVQNATQVILRPVTGYRN